MDIESLHISSKKHFYPAESTGVIEYDWWDYNGVTPPPSKMAVEWYHYPTMEKRRTS